MIYNASRLIGILAFLTISGAYAFFRRTSSQSGFLPTIRRIAGLDAIEEAVTRATEMGKPVHTSPGIARTTRITIPTLVGAEIVAYVASLAAKYQTKLIVTTMHPPLFPILQERVKAAFRAEGREEMVTPETVRFITDDASSYCTGVQGIIEREECAANITVGVSVDWMLMMFARAPSIGLDCLQIGGTTGLGNCCHCIATCDYVIFGEECYAAQAYLTRDFDQLMSMYVGDIFKWVFMGLITLGFVLNIFGNDIIGRTIVAWGG